jgi:anti-anti-sigma factor
VDDLVDALLSGLVGSGRSDDVAVVVARLVPVPLHLDLVGDAGRLREVRAAVRRWATLAALDGDTTDDLLLAVGEAAANAVEHAYAGAAGPLRVSVAAVDGNRVDVTVADEGRWRPPPRDPGFRGRGLSLLRELTDTVDVERGPAGTVVRFRLALPAVRGAATDVRDAAPDGHPPRVTVTGEAGGRCVALYGDLDLSGVAAVRADLLAALAVREPVALDLTGLSSLSSSGLGLLLEAARGAGGPSTDVLLPDAGPVRRLLDMTGLAEVLRRGH